MPPRASLDRAQKIAAERDSFRKRLDNAAEEDDPLAVYVEFVQWTLKTYGDHDPNSGLVDLLDKTTRDFKEDPLCRTDLRYLKLWSLYAKQFDRRKALGIYADLILNSIGTSFSLLYEEYAGLLEAEGRIQEAEAIYTKGIQRRARPLERLKTRYNEFTARTSASSSEAKTTSSRSSGKNRSHSSPKPSASGSSTFLIHSTPESRYAQMLAPPPPEKRPEKMRLDFSLLFTDEGVEYSIQEARARSMGLLGKKWGPPQNPSRPALVASARKSMMGGGAEPTMTINTKEALEDVFGMYNSPEKAIRLPGSKHAPVKKIESLTPVAPSRLHRVYENENAPQENRTPAPAFRPFTDENAQSSRSTPGQPKFVPFVDPELQQAAGPTPRPALTVKEAISSHPKQNENADQNNLKPKSEVRAENVFASKVFTPAQPKPSPLRDVFTDDYGKPQSKQKLTYTHERARSHHDALSPSAEDVVRAAAFKPFIDENAKTPFKVFSRPPEQLESNAIAPKSTFTPFVDPKPALTPYRDTPAFTPFTDERRDSALRSKPDHDSSGQQRTVVEIEDSIEEPEEEESEEGQEEYEYEEQDVQEPYNDPINDANIDYEPYQEIPLGGRFGKFNIMTPITERTFELTTSTRRGTPSRPPNHDFDDDDDDGGLALKSQPEDAREPVFIAEQEHPAHKQDTRVSAMEEKAGSLSLSDTLTLNLKFKPPNPCNPFDPSLLAALLSRIPTDPLYYNLQNRRSNLLDGLQKFSRKTRQSSGKSDHTGALDASFSVTLDDHQFIATEKLGEGGFGAVFKARDSGSRRGDLADSDDDWDDDDDEEGSSMVALKVVRPRNIWEYHVLRRLHSVLPASLRRSVILPHSLYAFEDESFLVLDYCSQGTLLNVVNGAVAAGVSQQGACLDELLVMFFAIELLRLLEGMHNTGFIHGDLKIDNCLLRLEDVPGGAAGWSSMYQPTGEGGWSYKGIKLIDFGRTIDTRLFPPDQKYIADWPTDDRDCFEIRENRPWSYQTDYFGLAGIIYCMLFGKYIQASSVSQVSGGDGFPRYKISTPFKRYWQTGIWNGLFDVLLNPCCVKPDGGLPIAKELHDLRLEMEKWLQANCNRTSNTLKGLLKKVEMSCYVR